MDYIFSVLPFLVVLLFLLGLKIYKVEGELQEQIDHLKFELEEQKTEFKTLLRRNVGRIVGKCPECHDVVGVGDKNCENCGYLFDDDIEVRQCNLCNRYFPKQKLFYQRDRKKSLYATCKNCKESNTTSL